MSLPKIFKNIPTIKPPTIVSKYGPDQGPFGSPVMWYQPESSTASPLSALAEYCKKKEQEFITEEDKIFYLEIKGIKFKAILKHYFEFSVVDYLRNKNNDNVYEGTEYWKVNIYFNFSNTEIEEFISTALLFKKPTEDDIFNKIEQRLEYDTIDIKILTTIATEYKTEIEALKLKVQMLEAMQQTENKPKNINKI